MLIFNLSDGLHFWVFFSLFPLSFNPALSAVRLKENLECQQRLCPVTSSTFINHAPALEKSEIARTYFSAYDFHIFKKLYPNERNEYAAGRLRQYLLQNMIHPRCSVFSLDLRLLAASRILSRSISNKNMIEIAFKSLSTTMSIIVKCVFVDNFCAFFR